MRLVWSHQSRRQSRFNGNKQMTSNANKYQARVWEAYRAWCKQGKAQESLDSIAAAFDVDPWQIELEHRTALDLY
jgi:hypothetical protein